MAKKSGAVLWYIFVLVSYGGPVVFCNWATPTTSRGVSNQNARRCYIEMAKDSDISHLLLDVNSVEKVDRFCRRISRLKKCVADYEHHLSNTENTGYLQKTQGVTAFYLNVCPPGTYITEKYKNNSPCFQLIKTKILSCGSDLPDLYSYKIKKDLNARCCALELHRACMRKAAATCGEEAQDVIEDILLRYFRPELDGCREGHCDPTTVHRDYHGEDNRDHTTYHHQDPEDDWKETTVADEWRRHRSKHSSGERETVSMLNVFSSLAFVLVQVVLLQ